MGLLDNITTRVNSIARALVPLRDPVTTVEEQLPLDESGTATFANTDMSWNYDWRTIVEQCRLMYDNDPRVQVMIDRIAQDAAKNSFEILITKGSAASKTIITDMVTRLRLIEVAPEYIKAALREGNCYLLLGIDDDQLIRKLQPIPTLNMTRNTDQLDRFVDHEEAYTFSFGGYLGSGTHQTFPEWMIVHARYNVLLNQKYGRPLFAAAVKVYYYLTDGERNIWVRRKLRSGVRFIHKVLGGPAKVKEYKRINKDALTSPASSIIDYYGNVDIAQLQGDARLSEIRDVLHFMDTLAVAAPIPIALIGFAQDINRDILSVKKEQYEEELSGIQKWFNAEVLRPLIQTQLLLQGVLPETVEYEVQWGNKTQLTPERLKVIMESVVQMIASGFTPELIASLIGPMIPQLSLESLLAGLQNPTTPPQTQPVFPDDEGETEEEDGVYLPIQRILTSPEPLVESNGHSNLEMFEELVEKLQEENKL